jgi:calcium/calmodulin-dependent protein kinase (CaM kinase) II
MQGTTASAAADAAASLKAHLVALQQAQLDAIAAGDYDKYAATCHPEITCFEPEARGHLVEGLPFHATYFRSDLNLAPGARSLLNTMSRPRVRLVLCLFVFCCVLCAGCGGG